MSDPSAQQRRASPILAGLFLVVAGFGPARAADGVFPWKAGQTPPPVAGIALGDSERHVRKVLGAPDTVSRMGPGHVLDYEKTGLEVVATPDDGVSIIRLRGKAAGDIDGVRVGDNVPSVTARWGAGDGSGGAVTLYTAGVWTVEVRHAPDGTTVTDLMLAWNTTKWEGFDPKKARFYRPQ